MLAAVRRFFRPESLLPSPEGLDWSELLRLADRHAVTAFLCHSCPNPELREIAMKAARVNLTLSAELLKLLDLFKQQAIDVVSLKGPVLGAALYGDEALKTSSDLDLLVRPRDALRAIHAMLAACYRLTSVQHWSGDGAYLRDLNGELSFSDPAGDLKIDLHWRLLPTYYPALFDDAELWGKLRPVPWGRTRALTLAPEHLLLFLCAHGTKHSWERLGWLCDTARLIQVESELNWSEVFAQARRTDTSRMLSLGLLLASDLLGVDIPPAAARLADADARTRALAGTALERLRADSPVSALDTARFGLRAFERRDNRMRLIAGMVCQPTEAEYRALKLPPGLYWLYYLFRPLRLAVRYSRRFIGRQMVSRHALRAP
ncbi:MAG: nucleotidyltransferase family protein [Candidatus Binataceae bacterium]